MGHQHSLFQQWLHNINSWLDYNLSEEAKTARSRTPAQLEELEKRVLYSATPLGDLLAEADQQVDTVDGHEFGTEAEPAEIDEIHQLISEADVAIDLEPLDNTEPASAVVFLDAEVDNYQQILDSIVNSHDGHVDVVLVSGNEDGIAAITRTLGSYSQLDSVHIISHGYDGGLLLGNSLLNTATLSQYSGQLAEWSYSLATDADLLIYGCDVADTDEGRDFVDSIAHLTGADVAASDDLTGHAELGGDWILEYATGDIESDLVISTTVQSSWYSTLDITTGLVGHYEFDSGGSTTDSTGNQDATVSAGNATGETAAVGDQSVGFAVDAGGNNSYLEVADNLAQDFGSGDFTVSLWYQQSGTPASTARLVGDFGGSGNGFVVYANASGALEVQLHDAGGTLSTSITGIFDGSWNQLTVVRSGSELHLFHNGVNVSTSSGADGDISSSNNLWMGSSGTLGGDFDGNLDDVRLYTRALTSTDVDELVALGPAVSPPPGPPSGYSDPSGSNNNFEWITNVNYAGIDNTTGQDTAGYGNYTTEIATVTQGDSNTLSVTINNDGDDDISAWIDWNQDGDFNDPGEEYIIATAASTDGPHTINIATPATATIGTTVMRIGVEWQNPPGPDGGGTYGEYEDYTVTVQASGPQTYTVTNTNDSGAGSLRQAIIDANANSGTDTIDFNIAGRHAGDHVVVAHTAYHRFRDDRRNHSNRLG